MGGRLSKQTNKSKVEWRAKNTENILNYDNGIVLNQAKDKTLFLSI